MKVRTVNHQSSNLRLVLYEDPLGDEIPHSPTMTKLSQFCSHFLWDIESFDIKTAFLRILGLEPPNELRGKLKLAPNEILTLLEGAYGRVDAPYLWYWT